MLDVSYEKKYVAIYKEIAIVFVAFSVVLLFLYPKDVLKQQILSEKSNYDLSMLYLKNMLKIDDSNEELMLILARQSRQSGNKDLSLKLLELLYNSANKETRTSAYMLGYQLAKDNYYYFEKQKMLQAEEKQYLKLQTIFKTIIQDKLYKEEDVETLYKEASFLKNSYASKLLVEKLLLKNSHDISLLIDAFYIARRNDENTKAVKYVEKLLALGVDNPYKWREVKFRILIENYTYADALNLLQKDATHSEYWQLKLATFYLFHKQYQKASDHYMIIFKTKNDFQEKKEFFKKAVKTLQSGNKLKDAVRLAHRYENYFFKDAQMRILLLKIYIGSNDLKKARALSKRMLKAGNY